ncbi:DUF1702 family protein [Actinoplanes sp. LDG1-06]|uniref:DUF1702 family protein n=1 Tax=Paractinoplanes ovalisporus TaxID=2810368 RepID=A0ABS2A301_9ACTN|nr:DUF1702 family protein [Actinoplanes ovalisporus]MBM2614218.1 DUF1702 family protein [Actinoplanes ovalisporus]
MARLRPHDLLRLGPGQVDFVRRGFQTEPREVRDQLERSALTFLDGFNRELSIPAAGPLDLGPIEPARRGFAAEGAAMAAGMLDRLRFAGRPRRLVRLFGEHAEKYEYLLHVGVGWTMAKLRCPMPRRPGDDNGLTRWLAYDGWGFCRAFFARPAALARWSAHPGSCDDVCAIRYQGYGRSIWFRDCGQPGLIANRIARLPARHRADVWSGVGLAAAYAGAVDAATYPRLAAAAARERPALAQGAAFAAEAHRRAGHLPAHLPGAVRALTGADVDEASGWTWEARAGLDRPSAGPADFQTWRQRIQRQAARVG